MSRRTQLFALPAALVLLSPASALAGDVALEPFVGIQYGGAFHAVGSGRASIGVGLQYGATLDVAIGGFAYSALSRIETDTLSPVYAELGEKFVGFVDVLSEVSERTSCVSNADLLRLYEKWLKTGSRRSGQLLVERGVVPNASIKSARIQ